MARESVATRILQLAIPLFVVFVDFHGQGGLLQRPIASFHVENVSRIKAVLMLANQNHVPVAIEYVGASMFETVSVQVAATELRTPLESIFPTSDGFSIASEDGVLVISHRDVPQDDKNLLRTRLQGFSIPKSSVQSASALLQVELLKTLKPDPQLGYGFSIPGEGAARVGPFSLKGVTVREALNQIVREHGSAAWIVQRRPESLTKIEDVMWAVVEYDSPSMGSIERITRQRAFSSPQER